MSRYPPIARRSCGSVHKRCLLITGACLNERVLTCDLRVLVSQAFAPRCWGSRCPHAHRSCGNPSCPAIVCAPGLRPVVALCPLSFEHLANTRCVCLVSLLAIAIFWPACLHSRAHKSALLEQDVSVLSRKVAGASLAALAGLQLSSTDVASAAEAFSPPPNTTTVERPQTLEFPGASSAPAVRAGSSEYQLPEGNQW
jgi:hypothetical protein